MTEKDLIDLLKGLVSIPSFSGEEKAAADYLQRRLLELGFHPQRVGDNLWLDSDPMSDKPLLLLNAHIDTVHPSEKYSRDPFAPQQEEGRIYGLGTNDDGGSLVALLGAYVKLLQTPQPYRLVWSATAQEENGGKGGMELILPEIGPVAFGIIGEPTGMKMAVAEKGLIVLDCVAQGVSGHAAREEGVNAIYRAMKDIGWLSSYRFPKVSEFLGEVKMTVTMINAGTQHNVIPDECRYVVDVRPNGLYTNEEILEVIRANVSGPVVPRSMRHGSSQIDLSHPAVKRGREMGLETFGSPTGSNQMLADFPTLKIGPGESSRSHAADEYIEINEIIEAISLYYKLLNNLEL